MNLDLNRIFGGGRVPDWLRTFAADPDTALHDLVLGRADLGHLTVADPVDLLLGWLRALGNRSGFAAHVDESLRSWILRNWGLIELPGGADSATLTSAAWVRVGELLAAAPMLTAAGDSLAQCVLADRRYLNSLCEGRSRDPQAAAWLALATHQRDRSLLTTWWQLCELPPDQPWYRGHCGIAGLRALPGKSAARVGGFPKEVAEGLNRFGLALWRLQDEGWLSPDLAAEEFLDVLRLCLSAYPFPDRWMSFLRHVLRRDYRRGDLAPWIQRLLPRVADDQPGKGSSKPNWTRYDPAWSDRRDSIAEKLRRGGEGAVAEAERLLADQHRYFERSGDSYGLTYSATTFSAAVRQGQPTQALQWARLAKEVEPWNSYAWNNEGQSLLVLGDRIAALEVYRESKARFPDNIVAYNGLAEALKAQNRFADAEAEYRETKARFPDNVVARNGLAEVLKTQKRFADAEAEYRETKARFPDNVVVRNGLAEVLKAQKRFADAEAEYRETKSRFPDNVVTRNGLAGVLRAEERLDEAEAEYREALKQAPNNVVALNGLAQVFQALGQFPDAEREYRDLKTANPKSLGPRNNLIFVLKAQGRWDEVVAEHQEAIDLFPENLALHMGLGAALVESNRLTEAEAHYRQAQGRFPEETFAYAKLADILVAQGRLSEAEHEYREARRRASDSFAAWAGLARVLTLQSRTEEAETEYRAMEERFPNKFVPSGNSDESRDSVPEDTDNEVITDDGDIGSLEAELPSTFPASVIETPSAHVEAPAKTSSVRGEEPLLNRREIDIVAGDAFLIRGWARATGTYDPDAAPGRFRERAGALLQRLLPSADADSVAAGESALPGVPDSPRRPDNPGAGARRPGFQRRRASRVQYMLIAYTVIYPVLSLTPAPTLPVDRRSRLQPVDARPRRKRSMRARVRLKPRPPVCQPRLTTELLSSILAIHSLLGSTLAMSTFLRPNLEVAFWRALQSGSHLLIPGPRRIGKTTLLKQALAQPSADFFPVYVFVESVDSVDELYRKLLSALLDQEFVGRLSRASRRFSAWVKRIRIEEIGAKVRFGAAGPVDHLGEFVQFCRGLELDGRIVLMVDELPQAVENTLGSKSEQERREAIRML